MDDVIRRSGPVMIRRVLFSRSATGRRCCTIVDSVKAENLRLVLIWGEKYPGNEAVQRVSRGNGRLLKDGTEAKSHGPGVEVLNAWSQQWWTVPGHSQKCAPAIKGRVC